MKKFAIVILCSLLLLSSCQKKSEESSVIKIATKPMTEGYILGEMLSLLSESAGYKTVVTKGVGGGTSNIQPAILRGDFDMYPEYTSSGWVLVLGHKAKELPDEELFTELKKEYEEKFSLTWLGLYGFNNTYTVAVRGDVAREYNLVNTSDLVPVAPSLVFGGNPDYLERADGFPALASTYGLEFKSISDIDIGLKYQALEAKDIDVTNAYTTDAQLANPKTDAVALKDDKNLQVNYFASTVVRQDTLASHPGLEEALMRLNGLISNDEMSAMNYKVEVEGADEREVAKAFLESKGVL